MAIAFTRGFQHDDWVDNVDRVQAAGDNGFNQRFHAIEGDLDAVGATVDLIARALDSLSATPPPQELRASITPILTATGGVGWMHASGFAHKLPGEASAVGMAGVELPHAARILRFRAIGRNTGAGALRVQLMRQSITSPTAAAESLARVDGVGDPYDQTVLAAGALQLVDNDRFKYYVTAQLNGAAAADTVTVIGLQVVYASS